MIFTFLEPSQKGGESHKKGYLFPIILLSKCLHPNGIWLPHPVLPPELLSSVFLVPIKNGYLHSPKHYKSLITVHYKFYQSCTQSGS